MLRHRITVITTVAIATVAAALPAAASATKHSTATQVRTVCAPWTYVKDRPDAIPIDQVKRGEKIDVKRYSPSGRWAQAMLRGKQHAHLKHGGWVRVSDLCAKGGAAVKTAHA